MNLESIIEQKLIFNNMKKKDSKFLLKNINSKSRSKYNEDYFLDRINVFFLITGNKTKIITGLKQKYNSSKVFQFFDLILKIYLEK